MSAGKQAVNKARLRAVCEGARTLSSCFRNAIQSAHSCTLSNELRQRSTCCVYFLYLGSAANAFWAAATCGSIRGRFMAGLQEAGRTALAVPLGKPFLNRDFRPVGASRFMRHFKVAPSSRSERIRCA
jgi:hypothetical protein